jgi:hypothetical protein
MSLVRNKPVLLAAAVLVDGAKVDGTTRSVSCASYW